MSNAVHITNTAGLLALARNAAKIGSTTQAELSALQFDIDPTGTHVLVWATLRGHEQMRTMWMVKMEGVNTAVDVVLDVSLWAFGQYVDKVPHPRLLEVKDEIN